MNERELVDFGGGTIGGLIACRAAAMPDKPAVMTRAARLTYGELDASATAVARGLLGLGLRKGDHAAIYLGNRAEWVTSWLGVVRAGMVNVPVNVGYKGSFLEYALALTKTKLLITEKALLGTLADVIDKLPSLGHVVVVDAVAEPLPGSGVVVLTLDELVAKGFPGQELPIVHPHDIAQVALTSGTTGRSKGVVGPHLSALVAARENCQQLGSTSRDVLYTCLPMFHGAAQTNICLHGFYAGATVVLGERFSASRFWDELREYRVTMFNALGSVLPMLLAQPPSERDRDHHARRVFAAPAPPDVLLPFEARFGVHVVEGYGLTEIKNVTYNPIDGRKVGSVGKPTETTELQIHDEHGYQVPTGEVGEIVYRPRMANVMFTHYLDDPEATMEATRGMWFHTGDLGYVDADGFYYFVDRKKDALRRRGENISSYEVESVLMGFPGVVEAAAVATPSELGEDEIIAFVEAESATLDLEALFRHCDARLPYFMVPRYFRVVGELPRTPTGKIQKATLRGGGLDECVWDAEAAGLRPTRMSR